MADDKTFANLEHRLAEAEQANAVLRESDARCRAGRPTGCGGRRIDRGLTRA